MLTGLAANGLLGWWWFDQVAGLAVAAAAIFEGRQAWRGESCCDDAGRSTSTSI